MVSLLKLSMPGSLISIKRGHERIVASPVVADYETVDQGVHGDPLKFSEDLVPDKHY